MPLLSKDQYQRRAENAQKRMDEQKEVSSLTEEQHEAIAEVCRMRHELHCNQDSAYLTESTGANIWRSYLDNESGQGLINSILNAAELETINSLQLSDSHIDDSYSYWMSDEDVLETLNIEYSSNFLDENGKLDDSDEADELRNDISNAIIESSYEETHEINNKIENFLRKIDEEHGTSYAPTGSQRLL